MLLEATVHRLWAECGGASVAVDSAILLEFARRIERHSLERLRDWNCKHVPVTQRGPLAKRLSTRIAETTGELHRLSDERHHGQSGGAA